MNLQKQKRKPKPPRINALNEVIGFKNNTPKPLFLSPNKKKLPKLNKKKTKFKTIYNSFKEWELFINLGNKTIKYIPYL